MQKIILTLKNYVVELDGNDPRDIWPAAAFWFSLPTECPVCHSPLTFEYTTPKTFKYYKLKCQGPTPHCVNLGQRQDGGSLYYDRSKTWEVFQPGRDDNADQGPSAPEKALQDPANEIVNGDRQALIDRICKQYADAKRRGLAVDRVPIETIQDANETRLRGIANFLDDIISRDDSKPLRRVS